MENEKNNSNNFWRKASFIFFISLIIFSILSYFLKTTIPLHLPILIFYFLCSTTVGNDISEPVESTGISMLKSILKSKEYIIFFSSYFLFVTTLYYAGPTPESLHFLLLLFAFSAYIYVIKMKIHTIFIKQFAKEEGYLYKEKMEVKDISGHILKGIKYSTNTYDIIEGQNENKDTRSFFYSYVEPTDKNSKEYFFSVFEKTFDGVFPHLLVIPKKAQIKIKRESVVLFTENSISTIFDVSVEKELEIEAYQILTPDVIEYILTNMSDSCLEFYKNKLYIIKLHQINTRLELRSFLLNGTNISQKCTLTAKQLGEDVTIMHKIKSYKKKSTDVIYE